MATTSETRHTTWTKRIASMWPSPEPQPGYVVECGECGRVGVPQLRRADAVAIAQRHEEVGGFER